MFFGHTFTYQLSVLQWNLLGAEVYIVELIIPDIMMATTFSTLLEMERRFEMGQKLFKIS